MRRFFGSLILLAGAACSSGSDGLECPQGTRSVGDVCRTTCFDDNECLTGERCVDNACMPKSSQDLDAGRTDLGEPIDLGVIPCEKNSDCGGKISGAWSACEYRDACDNSGDRQRTVTEPFCAPNGVCAANVKQENDICGTRNTDDEECAPSEVGMFGECIYESECAVDGQKRRDVVHFKCSDQSCRRMAGEEFEACPRRSTEHRICGNGTEETPGPCTFQEECTTEGVQEISSKTYGCRNAQCVVTSMSVRTAMCTRVVNEGERCAGDAGHCCSGLCYPRDDPANCGVCGIQCSTNSACEPVLHPNGDVTYACGCEGPDQCSSYGPNATCLFITPTTTVCRCECPAAMSQCTGVCPTGECFSDLYFGYCDYP